MKKRAETADARQRLDEMLSRLKENEFRITPQRMAVLKVLAVSEGHPTVERIYETVRADFPTTSIATIYKTVNLLKELGEVLELGFPDGSNRYDGNKPYPHPHVICTECKKIIEVLYRERFYNSSIQSIDKCIKNLNYFVKRV